MKPLKVLEGGWRKIKEEEEPGGTRDMKYEMDGTAKLEGTRWRERKVPAGERGGERGRSRQQTEDILSYLKRTQ